MTPVALRHVLSVPVAVIRRQVHPSGLSRAVPECCGLVWDVVREQHARAGRNIAIYWDGSIRLEAGVELEGPFTERGEVVRSATPAGAVAMATHLGPYGNLRAAHDAIQKWCTAGNYRMAGPSWELYGHWQPEWNADASRIRTDVYYLLSEESGS